MVGTAVDEEVTTFMSCSPAVLAVVMTVDATVLAAVEAAPNTLPECLRVCLRMTSEDGLYTSYNNDNVNLYDTIIQSEKS